MRLDDIAASAPAAAAVGRVAWAVAVTGSVDFALDDNAIIAVVVGNEQSQNRSDEEKDDVHDAKGPRCLEHSALAVDIEAIGVSRDSEYAQIRTVGAGATPVGAVCISNASELIDGTDKGAHKEKVDKGNKLGRVPGARVEKQSRRYPCSSED